MRKLLLSFGVAGLIALSPKSEARNPAPTGPLPIVIPQEKENFQIGIASWYGEECTGNYTASGEAFDLNGLTAAHRELAFGTIVKVTNLNNHRSVRLRVNDRGPGIEGRLIDVTWAAAKRLGFVNAGLTPVQVKIVDYAKGSLRQPQTTAN